MLHPPRTGGSSIRRSWMLGPEEYQSHDFPGEKGPDEWWYGFTRNPWDRVVSLWHWPPGRAENEISFRDFVLGGFRRPAQGPGFSRLMASPTIRWLERADFIGRFEQRDTDLGRLAKILNRPVPELHIGPTEERRPYRDYYDDETRLAVARAYAEDIQAFGYGF